jgi:hypothetical protein
LTPVLWLTDTSRSADEGNNSMTATSGGPAPQGFAHFRDFYPYLSVRASRSALAPAARPGDCSGDLHVDRRAGDRPATFRHPFYSLAGDFVMFKDVLTGRIKW